MYIYNRHNGIKRLLLLLGETYLVLVIVTLVACLSFHMWTQFGIDNKGVPQFSLLDKIKLAYFYCISYKLGIIGKREWDHQYLYKLIQHDPVLTKLFRSFRHKYGKVAVSDIPFGKCYVVLDPTFAVQLLKRDDKLRSGTFKEIVSS